MQHVIIVGAQRSGSTYLYEVLDSHPEIAMARPVRPEPKYFLDEESEIGGVDRYVETVFGCVPDGVRVLGEKSTTYIERPDAARRMRAVLPHVRILMILRDPVARAWSNYGFSVANGLESLSFADALDQERVRTQHSQEGVSTSPFAYRARGEFIRYVDAYLQVFDPRQIRIEVLEELRGNVDGIQALYRWLGVDDAHVPAMRDTVVNSTRTDARPDPAQLRALARDFEASVAQLEEHLQRPLDAWRARWAEL